MCGALIPEKYDLDRTVPGYPWVCPVRSCRNVFKKILNLGSHFAVSKTSFVQPAHNEDADTKYNHYS